MENKNEIPIQPSLKKLLLEIIDRYSVYVPCHPWYDEYNRWREMVVCILFAFGHEAKRSARQVVDILDELGLLKIEDLARLPWSGEEPDLQHPHTKLISDVMERIGYARVDISCALNQIFLSARDLQVNCDGKIQVYLRKQGQHILSSLKSDLPSLQTEDNRLHFAWIMWLQNVLMMPLFLNTQSTIRFCEFAGCTLDELQRTTDELDISASLLDDLLDLWLTEHEME